MGRESSIPVRAGHFYSHWAESTVSCNENALYRKENRKSICTPVVSVNTVNIWFYALHLYVTCYITGRIAIDNFHENHRQISQSSSGIQFRQEDLNYVMGLLPSGPVGAPVDVDPPPSVPPLSTSPSRYPSSPTPPSPTPPSSTPPLSSLHRLASHLRAHVSRPPAARQWGRSDAGSCSVGPDRSAQGMRSTPYSLRFGDPEYQRVLEGSCH